MTALLTVEKSDRVVRFTLNDQPTRNSLSLAMLDSLKAAIEAASADKSVAAVIIASRGNVFSSGHNLKELTAHRADTDKGARYFETVFERCAEVMARIAQHRCAVIAEVDGLASAAGCQLVASCDLAYASPRASFCTPGVNIGLFCSTPMVAVSRALAPKHAMEMLLTGDVYDAAHAERIGLINRVVAQNELSGFVAELAARIASKSASAIAHGKPLFYEQRMMNLHDAYGMAAAVMTKNMLDGAACEGIDAFIAKRRPSWPTLT